MVPSRTNGLTLGEEYCDIQLIQLQRNRAVLRGTFHIGTLLTLQVLVPYLLKLALRRLEIWTHPAIPPRDGGRLDGKDAPSLWQRFRAYRAPEAYHERL